MLCSNQTPMRGLVLAIQINHNNKTQGFVIVQKDRTEKLNQIFVWVPLTRSSETAAICLVSQVIFFTGP